MCHGYGRYYEPTREEQKELLERMEKHLQERLAEIKKAKEALAKEPEPSGTA